VVKISLFIDKKLTPEERRHLDSKIVIESYNSQVFKIKSIIEQEDNYDFKDDEDDTNNTLNNTKNTTASATRINVDYRLNHNNDGSNNSSSGK
jgi:hypothetical protein